MVILFFHHLLSAPVYKPTGIVYHGRGQDAMLRNESCFLGVAW